MKNIYIHIPFCVKKCFYCDFSVFAIGKNLDNKLYYENYLEHKYVDYLLREIDYKKFKKKNKLETIYFGGGTPSLLSVNSLEKIFNKLNKNFIIDNDTEITTECEPKTLNNEKLSMYKNIGINRISLGLQTFNNKLLKSINRNHTKEDFTETYNLIKKNDFKNINVDIIIGIPGDNLDNFNKTIDRLIEFRPNHISLYYFTLEPKSYFGNLFKKGKLNLIKNVLDYNLIIQEKLKNYEQYEISNFCNNKFFSKHNLMYWEGDKDYLSFGVGSVSLENGLRISRPNNINNYYKYIEEDFNDKYLKIDDERNNLENYLKTIFMGNLRRNVGIKFSKIEEIFLKFNNNGFNNFLNKIKLYLNSIDKDYFNLSGNHFNLTNKGFLRNNDILYDIFNIIEEI